MGRFTLTETLLCSGGGDPRNDSDGMGEDVGGSSSSSSYLDDGKTKDERDTKDVLHCIALSPSPCSPAVPLKFGLGKTRYALNLTEESLDQYKRRWGFVGESSPGSSLVGSDSLSKRHRQTGDSSVVKLNDRHRNPSSPSSPSNPSNPSSRSHLCWKETNISSPCLPTSVLVEYAKKHFRPPSRASRSLTNSSKHGPSVAEGNCHDNFTNYEYGQDYYHSHDNRQSLGKHHIQNHPSTCTHSSNSNSSNPANPANPSNPSNPSNTSNIYDQHYHPSNFSTFNNHNNHNNHDNRVIPDNLDNDDEDYENRCITELDEDVEIMTRALAGRSLDDNDALSSHNNNEQRNSDHLLKIIRQVGKLQSSFQRDQQLSSKIEQRIKERVSMEVSEIQRRYDDEHRKLTQVVQQLLLKEQQQRQQQEMRLLRQQQHQQEQQKQQKQLELQQQQQQERQQTQSDRDPADEGRHFDAAPSDRATEGRQKTSSNNNKDTNTSPVDGNSTFSTPSRQSHSTTATTATTPPTADSTKTKTQPKTLSNPQSNTQRSPQRSPQHSPQQLPDYITKAKKLVEQLKRVQASVVPFETNKAVAKRRLEFKKTVNGKVNTLAENVDKIKQVAAEVSAVIANARREDEAIKNQIGNPSMQITQDMCYGKRYMIDLLCSKVIVRVQAEGFNGPRGDGFPLAAMLAMVAKENKDMIPVMAAHIYTVCPTAIPSLPSSSPGGTNTALSEEEFMKDLGMLPLQNKNNNSDSPIEFESFERFLSRTEGVISLVANIMSSQPSDHMLLDGHRGALIWLKRFLALLPRPPLAPLPLVTAPVLDAFLRGAGHMLANHYADEFRQILDHNIIQDVMTRLDVSSVGMPSSIRLQKCVEKGFHGFLNTLPPKALPELYYGSNSTTSFPSNSNDANATASKAFFSSSSSTVQSSVPGAGGKAQFSSNSTSNNRNPFTTTNTNPSPFGAPASTNTNPSPFGAPASTNTNPSPFGTSATTNTNPSLFGTSATTNITNMNPLPFGTSATTNLNPLPFGTSATTNTNQNQGMSDGNSATTGGGGWPMSNSTSLVGGGSLSSNPSPFGTGGTNTASSNALSFSGGNSGGTPFGASVQPSFSSFSLGGINATAATGGNLTTQANPFGGGGGGVLNTTTSATPFGSFANSTNNSNQNQSSFGAMGTPGPFGSNAIVPNPSPFGVSNLTSSSTAAPFGGVGGSGASISNPFGATTTSNVNYNNSTISTQNQSPFANFGAGASSASSMFGNNTNNNSPFGGSSWQQSLPFGSTGTSSTNNKNTVKPPCKFFSQGRCNRGNNCQFSHEAVPSSISTPLFGAPRR